MYWTLQQTSPSGKYSECILMSEDGTPILVAGTKRIYINPDGYIGQVKSLNNRKIFYETSIFNDQKTAMDHAKENCQSSSKMALKQIKSREPKHYVTSSDGPSLSFVTREEYDEYKHDELILKLYHYKKMLDKYGYFDYDKQAYVKDYQTIKSLNPSQLEIYKKEYPLLEQYKNEIQEFENMKKGLKNENL